MSPEISRNIPIREGDKDTLLYQASPFEYALDMMVNTDFETVLDAAAVTANGNLRRLSYPQFFSHALVVFQYQRFDISQSHPEYLLSTYRKLNPSDEYSRTQEALEKLEKGGGGWTHEGLDEIETLLDKLDKLDDQDQAAIMTGIERRFAGSAVRRALPLTDPGYYLEGSRVVQWPEEIRFVVFNRDNKLPDSDLQTAEIDNKGRFHHRRPDVYGKMRLIPQIEGMHIPQPDPKLDDGKVTIGFPRMEYEIARANLLAFESERITSLPEGVDFDGLDLEELKRLSAHNATRLTIHHYINPQTDPQLLVREIGTFISEFTRQIP